MSMELQQKPVIGGLNTKLPPTMLPGNTSPDLLNIAFTDGSADKRPGFTPMFKDRLMMNAVRNQAYRTTGKVGTGGADIEYLRVYGALYAGHRPIYETLTALTIEFFYSAPDELPTTNGSDGSGTVATTITVRPLISKGPVKRTFDNATAAPINASCAWNTTAATVWGNHSLAGMPFCVYLYNSSGTWRFRNSSHYYDVGSSGAYSLESVTSSIDVVPGATYHIQLSLSSGVGSVMRMRVGRIIDGVDTTYVDNSTSCTPGNVTWNKCPIQVFDCPQQFIEATVTGSGTQRPGLHLMGSPGNIGIFCDMTRAEGAIEDIVVWNSDKSINAGNCDRSTKLLNQDGMVNYWPMLKGTKDYTEDACGRSNHLYLSPGNPVYDSSNGGVDSASWFFNGLTSYAKLNIGSYAPFWRWCKSRTAMGAFSYLVINNKAHGVAADVWIDSVEPQFEQVIAEIHGCMRVVVNTSGNIAVYCRTGSGVAGYDQIGATYQLAVTGSVVVSPGSRYNIAAIRDTGGTTLSLYINGVLDAQGSALTASHASGYGLGSVTVGMGSYQILIRGASATDTNTAHWNYVNTDQRSGFFGRVESFRILCGEDAANLYKYSTPAQTVDDYIYDDLRTWSNTAASTTLTPADAKDLVRSGNGGFIVYLDGHTENGELMAYAVASTGTNSYTLHTATFDQLTGDVLDGHEVNTSMSVKVFHQIAVFHFNVDPRQDQATGYYQRFERRYNGGAYNTPGSTANGIKGVHSIRTTVEDESGFFGNVDGHCIESDLLYENETQVFTTKSQLRNRPFDAKSPWELRPKFTEGIVRPLPDQCEVSLIADWDHQESKDRYIIAASGRNMYWARPLWKDDSPFSDQQPVSMSLPGGFGSYIYHQATDSELALTGTAPKTTVSFECWIKPRRVDGLRMIAIKHAAGTQLVNWGIGINDGSVIVFGTEGGIYAWRFTEGSSVAGAAEVNGIQSIRCNSWNHLSVTIGPGATGIQVRVNGKLAPMVDSSDLAGSGKMDPFDNQASDGSTSPIYIGGLPRGRELVSMACDVLADTVDMRFASYDGLMSEVRIRNAEPVDAATDAEGMIPPIRFGDEAIGADTLLYLAMNEGDGWLLADQSASAESAHASIRSFTLIAEDLEESTGNRYEYVAFRDRLMLTNGVSDPLQIRVVNKLADPPFKVERLGIGSALGFGSGVTASTSGTTDITDATYAVYMTGSTFDGHESEPIYLGSYVLSTGGAGVAAMVLRVSDVPRYADPQVIYRNFYVSANGGGAAILNRVLANVGSSVNLEVGVGATGVSTEAGDSLPAPRARKIAVAGASIILGDLVDEAAGQNAIAFSTPSDAAAFTVTSQATMDTEDGKPIIGVKGSLGQFYVSKRDSIYVVAVGAIVTSTQVDASIRVVSPSDGVGGGTVAVGPTLVGAGDRGLFSFDGANPSYASEPIERLWRDSVDRSDTSLRNMQGVYMRQRSELWFSVKLKGESARTRAVTLKIGQDGQWSYQSLPSHSYFCRIEDPLRQSQLLVLGTTSGAILRMNESVFMDAADQEAMSQGAVTISGSTSLSGSATSLTIASGRFSTVGSGLSGAEVSLVYNSGTVTRKISWNTSTTIHWYEPIDGWTSFTSFAIGGYDGYWTSPWLADGKTSGEQEAVYVDLEMVPRASNVTLDIASIRQGEPTDRVFPTSAYESFTIDQTTGWSKSPSKPRSHSKGHYHRVRISTSGPNTPFGIVGYYMDMRQLKAIGHTGRII